MAAPRKWKPSQPSNQRTKRISAIFQSITHYRVPFRLNKPFTQDDTRKKAAFSHWKSGVFGNRIADFETPVQPFPGASLSQTEAHLHFNHHARFGPWGDVRRDRAHSRHLGHDRFRSRVAPESDRLRRAHSRYDRRHHAQLARTYRADSQHLRRRRDSPLHPGTGHRRVSEPPPRADDSRDRA